MNFTNCLFSSSDLHGCGWMRSYLPAKYLDAQFMGGFDRFANHDHISNFFFQRHSHVDFIDMINNIHTHGKKVFYDLDDDVWAISDLNPAKGFYTPQVLYNIETILSMCDGVYTSTLPLKNVLTKFNSNVNIVPNLVEIPVQHKEQHQKIRIGYSGSKSHVGDFSPKLVYALIKLFKKYKDKIEYFFIGYIPEELKPYATFIGGVETQHYIEALNYIDFDISLISLKDTEFNKSKSNLKWLDSSITRSCPVASDVYCYSEIEDGVTGIKVRDDRWYDILEELIFNDDKRRYIADQAHQYVLNNYTWQYAKHKQEDVYNGSLK